MKADLLRIPMRGDIVVDALLTIGEHPRGFCVLMHGLGGLKEQEHIAQCAEILAKHGFTTVRPDAADDISRGDDAVTHATTTKRIENIEDVRAFARTQPWGAGIELVGGHSLGGIAAGTVAARDVNIRGAILLAPVVSGDIQWSRRGAAFAREWKAKGTIEREFATRKGTIYKIGYELSNDARRYSLLKEADQLARIPCFLAVGSLDEATPASELDLLEVALGTSAGLNVIVGAKHNFRGFEPQVTSALDSWLTTHFPR